MGIHIPEILIPHNVDMNKWAVIACDQFTSEKDYWKEISTHVDDGPSTLRLIFPEVFLDDNEHISERREKIDGIKDTMHEYIDSNILKELEPGFILVDRSTPYNPSRKGLILAIDLEHYSFTEGDKSLIRPTEGTVVDRLPPRIEIREDAPLDLPHILLLINDKKQQIIEDAFNHLNNFEELYDFDLMQNGGSIRGHLIKEEKYLTKICEAFEEIFSEDEMLFAVGDGNHSLASAKKIWDQLKTDGAEPHHPARYALVEVNNIYNDGVIFEPIHRVLFNINSKDFLGKIHRDTKATITENITEDEVKRAIYSDTTEHVVGYLHDGVWGLLSIDDPNYKLSYEVVQREIDDYIQTKPGIRVDYIHGDRIVNELGQHKNNLVLYFPAINKDEFFSMINVDGTLPRKTFSIGEAEEKRYYIESRKIR